MQPNNAAPSTPPPSADDLAAGYAANANLAQETAESMLPLPPSADERLAAACRRAAEAIQNSDIAVLYMDDKQVPIVASIIQREIAPLQSEIESALAPAFASLETEIARLKSDLTQIRHDLAVATLMMPVSADTTDEDRIDWLCKMLGDAQAEIARLRAREAERETLIQMLTADRNEAEENSIQAGDTIARLTRERDEARDLNKRVLDDFNYLERTYGQSLWTTGAGYTIRHLHLELLAADAARKERG